MLLIGRLLSAGSELLASLLPKSVTTAIVVSLSESMGGGSLTAASVIFTGLEGAMPAPLLMKVFRAIDPIALCVFGVITTLLLVLLA